MKHLMVGCFWSALGIIPLFVLIPLMFSGCAEGISSEVVINDECFTGTYTDGRITLRVVHHSGLVTASCWKESGLDVPWDSFYFNGKIIRVGEALGDLSVYFPPAGGGFSGYDANDVTLYLASTGIPGCGSRRTMTLSFSYTLDGRGYTESYTLNRGG